MGVIFFSQQVVLLHKIYASVLHLSLSGISPILVLINSGDGVKRDPNCPQFTTRTRSLPTVELEPA